MKLNLTNVLTFFLLLAVIPFALFGLQVYRFVDTPVQPPQEQLVQIEPGTSLTRIARQLEDQGIVSDARQFSLYARWQGTAEQVQAGEYLFAQPATPGEVLARLVAGDVRKLQVTIPEGFTLREIAKRVEAAEIGDAEVFLALATDPREAALLGVDAETLEGYLFPETYTVQSTTSPQELIRAMYEQFMAEVTPAMLEAAEAHALNRHQLVTLASIIQKEAGNNAEMPLISAVFHNRLSRGIALQADPTVIYGIADFDGNLTRRHLETPTPYNTYRMRGLPPGPIASPGREALRAAAFPADVDYLYFVARGDGSHEFNSSLKAHNRAVQRYQLGR